MMNQPTDGLMIQILRNLSLGNLISKKLSSVIYELESFFVDFSWTLDLLCVIFRVFSTTRISIFSIR
jgi:hypothetical protein